MISTSVFINTQKEFIHQYERAPEEVAYLRFPHRHIAHINVEVEVFHDDREIEFIMMKHKINEFLDSLDLTHVTNNSCEMIARSIVNFIRNEYSKDRNIQVIVSEDGENGCKLVYTKEFI